MPATAPRTTLTPFVVAPDCAAFLDFAAAAFDAMELERETDGSGRVVDPAGNVWSLVE